MVKGPFTILTLISLLHSTLTGKDEYPFKGMPS